MSHSQLAAWMFLQLAFILCVIRGVGYLARYVGQPRVVGEMIAGVLIGPSVLGQIAPGAQAWLFPRESLPIIFALSQIGLVLYMFVVGLEVDRRVFRHHARGAVMVSVAGVAVPFVLGGLFAKATFDDGILFGSGLSLTQAMLFVGAAMSITAFPMLARIIKERGLTGTPAGVLALTAGATDDAAAWCILAVVLSSFQGDSTLAWLAIVGGAAYAVVVLGAMLPLLSAWETRITLHLRTKSALLGAAMILLTLGAWFTDYVGIYAVFGAFVLGVAMPRKHVATSLRRDIEPLVTVVFLPLFFVYSGLNTRISLLFTPTVLLYSLIIIVLASLGKGLACALAARYAGQSPRESLMIGALMNARGLMELILLNIGLERGVITPTLFAMMVMMAIVTTFMASPIFSALHVRSSQDEESAEHTRPERAAYSS